MTVLRHELRPGRYLDSIVLMQLQAALAERPGVLEAGAVMGIPENLALLEASGLLPEVADRPGPSDLLVVVRAESAAEAEAALGRVDELLARDRSGTDEAYRPRGLASAVRLLPAARWVLVSVPGRFAAGVAREALALERHVFLFSDHVPLEEEVSLKREARARGLLVMGPDCGTAMIRGVGFGFANRVRRGPIGIVAASGTGLQAVACRIHALGSGVSHAIGTGGRDTTPEVGGATVLQGLDLLARDPETRAIVLISKPPAPEVAGRLLAAAERAGKPVVVYFTGSAPPSSGAVAEPVHFATSLAGAASLAVRVAGDTGTGAGGGAEVGAAEVGTADAGTAEAGMGPAARERLRAGAAGPGSGGGDADEPLDGFLRGLLAGGTLAHEVLQAAKAFLPTGTLYSNLEAEGVGTLPDPVTSRGHTVLDLGADVFTAGRPHPMLDNGLRIARLRREAEDPEVGLLLLDVVLGDGAHPDPAAELAPAVEAARAGREVEIVAILVGTDEDPQDAEVQASRLAAAGARVFRDVDAAMEHVRRRLGGRAGGTAKARAFEVARDEGAPSDLAIDVPVGLEALRAPVAAIDVGLEAFHESLVARDVRAVHVDWRPPAGGDERLAAILEKMRR